MEDLRVRNVMTREVTTLKRNDKLTLANDIMQLGRIHGSATCCIQVPRLERRLPLQNETVPSRQKKAALQDGMIGVPGRGAARMSHWQLRSNALWYELTWER
jgi:hypothetical protein